MYVKWTLHLIWQYPIKIHTLLFEADMCLPSIPFPITTNIYVVLRLNLFFLWFSIQIGITSVYNHILLCILTCSPYKDAAWYTHIYTEVTIGDYVVHVQSTFIFSLRASKLINLYCPHLYCHFALLKTIIL